jgi:crotonobetainyl-CoA:carnitine CoA-transferase CaiB-like acyl-CoA transferase
LKRPKPLAGVRIADLTHYWSGPHATRILADLGAEVIKIEYPRRMCVLRGRFREPERYNGFPRWHQVNRNKKSITLDMSRKRDQDLFWDLVRRSDVVTENSRGGVMRRFGITYERARQVKPDIIMLSMPACGTTGPWSEYAGVGGSLEPLSALQSLTAYSRDGRRYRTKEADVFSGVLGASAVLTALNRRKRTGRGQAIDLSQLEALSHTMMGAHFLEYVMNRQQTLPLGNRHPYYAPQGCYPCRGEDKWVALVIRSEEEWRAFSSMTGRPDWAEDERFRTRESRRRHHDELDREIAAITRELEARELMGRLQQHGIAAGAVLNLEELAADPQLAARSFFQLDGPDGKRYPGLPGRDPGWGVPVLSKGPGMGADNEWVAIDLLGRATTDVPGFGPEDIGSGYDSE